MVCYSFVGGTLTRKIDRPYHGAPKTRFILLYCNLKRDKQERRKFDQRVKNLYEAIADATDRDLRLGLTQTANETRQQLSQVELALEDLKRDLAQTNNVIDISGVLEFIRIFRESAFDAQPVAAQAEILKNRIRPTAL